ncbi:MAG: FecR domain-containing protein [Saprospiraceae bacterium]
MNNFDSYSELIGKHLAGETSPAEERDLFAWIAADGANRQFFEEMEKVWKTTESAHFTPFETDTGAAWMNIEQAIDTSARTAAAGNLESIGKTSTRIVPLSKIRRYWSMAAAILLILAAGLWWAIRQPAQPLLVEVKTGSQEKNEVVLPDGSHVWLNENTRIAYHQDFSARKINLEGEAFFDVERMETSPFEITSGGAKTTVLGTTFNVRAYPSENLIEVTVRTGKVALAASNQPSKPVIIPAGSSGVLDKKVARVVVESGKIVNADAWKTQKLEFDNALVEDVLNSLERYFDTKISVSNEKINSCHFKAVFEKPEIEETMKVLAFGLNLQLEKAGDGYVLKGEGCEPGN